MNVPLAAKVAFCMLFVPRSSLSGMNTVQAKFIDTFAGAESAKGYAADGGLATDHYVFNPYAVAVDSAGNGCIADTHNQTIRKISASGHSTTVPGNHSGRHNGVGNATDGKTVLKFLIV